MALPPSGTGTRDYAQEAGAGTSTKSTGQSALPVMLLVFAVFFLFGGITNLNDVLIPKFKGLFNLTYTQAMLVQFAFFTSYAVFSIPAGLIMKRLGYVRGIMVGFAIMAVSCLLFVPAARSASYGMFLIALFMIGGGITLLQVAVNPLIIQVGDPKTAHSRLTFAQLFNSIGVTLMVYFGAKVILGAEALDADPSKMSEAALQQYRVTESAVIANTYVGLAIVLALIALFFWIKRNMLNEHKVEEVKLAGTFGLLRNPRLAFGVLCIFLYVGAEVGIASIMVSYLGEQRVMGLDHESAGKLLAFYWGGAMVGRLLGGFLLRLSKPGKLLALFAAGAISLIVISSMTSGTTAGYALILVGFCNSIMFPTIFSLATEGLHEEAPQASGLLCTAIVGGAIVPLIVGLVADNVTLTASLAVPVICYVVIAAFGLYAARKRVEETGAA